jgi:alcohol dehydrogenase class IV
MYEFRWPTRTLFGRGLSRRIGEYLIPSSRSDRLLLVAPHEKWAQPLIMRLNDHLQEVGWRRVETFNAIEPNPSWETVSLGVEQGRKLGVEAVLAFGGGSSLDASKVIAEQCGASILCTIPTTAGTGSEISPWAVISNTRTREKESLMAKWPDIALLDPELTLTLPPRTTLFTGVDAFIHGLEAYLSKAATPITDALAFAGMERIADNLFVAVTNGENLEARSEMLQGSLLTGASMLHAGLGLMHAIGNVVGGLYHDLPHGLILMQCMEVVLEYNRPIILECKLDLLEPLVDRMWTDVQALFAELKVPEIELHQDDLPLIAERASANVNAQTSPRPGAVDDIESLVRQAFKIC